MRQIYETTPQTIKAITGHEQKIASEYGCNASYIYGISEREKNDPYAHFRHLFKSTAYAGGETSAWLNDLIAIDLRAKHLHLSGADIVKTFLKKIESDAATTAKFFEAISDGEIDERETDALLVKLAELEVNTAKLKLALQARKASFHNATAGSVSLINGRK